MKPILIIEDDQLLGELERDYLEAYGYTAEICTDGLEGLQLAQSGRYLLIVLDVMLPGVSGFQICREVRETQNIPILLVTAKQDEVDKIRGLGLGADDYITKPFSPAELVARVRAHLRIHERLLGDAVPAQPARIDAGALQILLDSRQVLRDGQEIHLKNREFERLWFLASHPGIVFSRDTLFERLWGLEAVGDTATVTVHINRLREKLETCPSEPVYIQTVRGAGYRFCIPARD